MRIFWTHRLFICPLLSILNDEKRTVSALDRHYHRTMLLRCAMQERSAYGSNFSVNEIELWVKSVSDPSIVLEIGLIKFPGIRPDQVLLALPWYFLGMFGQKFYQSLVKILVVPCTTNLAYLGRCVSNYLADNQERDKVVAGNEHVDLEHDMSVICQRRFRFLYSRSTFTQVVFLARVALYVKLHEDLQLATAGSGEKANGRGRNGLTKPLVDVCVETIRSLQESVKAKVKKK